MSNNEASFNTLDFGSVKPTSVPQETITVELTSDNLIGDYAKAFVTEAHRVNPLLSDQINLTPEELESYASYLLYKRVQCVNNECSDFRKLKLLYIPVWIQYNLSMIGEVIIRDKGLRIVPSVEESNLTFEEALKISNKVGAFENDLQIVQDAMPRDRHGDVDVMSTALIAGYVRSIEKVEHVSSTYLTAFLGMKLREEMAFKTLYRVQYDDVNFIASAFTSQRGLI